MTPGEYRAEAEHLRQEAQRILDEATDRAALLIEQAERLEALAVGQERIEGRAVELFREANKASPSLQAGGHRAMVRHDMQPMSIFDPKGRKVGRPIKAAFAFPKWLRDHNVQVAEWAMSHVDPETGRPFKRSRVKSWTLKGSGARKVPRVTADLIEAESKDPETGKSAVPATVKSWPNGISE